MPEAHLPDAGRSQSTVQAAPIASTDPTDVSVRPAVVSFLGVLLIVLGALGIMGLVIGFIYRALSPANARSLQDVTRTFAASVVQLIIGLGIISGRRWAAIAFVALGGALLGGCMVWACWTSVVRYGGPFRFLTQSNLAWLFVVIMVPSIVAYAFFTMALLRSRTRAWFAGRAQRSRRGGR